MTRPPTATTAATAHSPQPAARITPRETRLVRAPDLRSFRDACVALSVEGDPIAARNRLILVPTRAAASHLTRAIENRVLASRGAVMLPELVTRDELYVRLSDRLPVRPRLLNPFEREVLLGVACRAAEEGGATPPFRLRPGLIAGMLDFYDTLRRHQKDVGMFERLVLDALEPGADIDRGAERLVRQTRFLVAAFRVFEQRCASTGALDEHAIRRALIEQPAPRPWRHVIVTVRDRAADPHGLWACDFDLLARLPGLERLDVIVTDTSLAGALHERLHQMLPGIEEVRADESTLGQDRPTSAKATAGRPVLLVPPKTGVVHVSRDREEEVAAFARRVRRWAKEADPPPLERLALVVRQPLPYVYIAREVLRSAAVPCQMFDALPLAAEPYAAAVDLVFTCVASNFSRSAIVALLRSPYFRFENDGHTLTPRDVSVLDRAMSDAGYLGDISALENVVATREGVAGAVALHLARELAPLRERRPAAVHLDVLLAFLAAHEAPLDGAGSMHARQLRARAAILGTLTAVREAHQRFEVEPVEFDELVAMVRRWIESQTFAPRTGEGGVHLVDAESARYGDFDAVQIAGLVESEWPDRPRRSIFYSPSLLRDLGWLPETERIDGARAAFRDLLRLPAARLVASAFTLEDDAIVASSPFVDEIESAGLTTREEPDFSRTRIFELEALALDPPRPDVLAPFASDAARLRIALPTQSACPDRSRRGRHRGATSGHAAPAFTVSALERYQDCPFKFFAADVLRLEEIPEDEPAFSPRARGRFVHEVFQRFFEEWDRQAAGTITAERLDEARALFGEVAEPLLARAPEAEAALERTRLFGSAIAPGLVDIVLDLEASRPGDVVDRWLEYRLEGEFSLGGSDGRRVALKGVADRIDLLAGRRLRVIDYKSGYPPQVKRALQVPIYALAASERLESRDGVPWTVDEAAYVAFSGKRPLVPVIKAGSGEPDAILAAARQRLLTVLDSIGRGDFPPRPFDPMICGYCSYALVCRKDYVGDEHE